MPFIGTSLHISVAPHTLYKQIFQQDYNRVLCWSYSCRYQGAVRAAGTHWGWCCYPLHNTFGTRQLTTWQFKWLCQNVRTHHTLQLVQDTNTVLTCQLRIWLMWEDWRRGSLQRCAMNMLGVRPDWRPLPTVCFLTWPLAICSHTCNMILSTARSMYYTVPCTLHLHALPIQMVSVHTYGALLLPWHWYLSSLNDDSYGRSVQGALEGYQ